MDDIIELLITNWGIQKAASIKTDIVMIGFLQSLREF